MGVGFFGSHAIKRVDATSRQSSCRKTMLNQNVNNCDLVMSSLKNERKTMNNKFDELTKGMAQSVTRRARR